MKRSNLLTMLIMVVLVLPWLHASQAGSREVVLFDGPRGGWLATVRADTAWEVLEERDGWRRVRLEGWIPVSSAARAAPPAGEAAAAGASDQDGRGGEKGSVVETSTAATLSGAVGSSADREAVGAGRPMAAPEDDRGATVSGVLLPTHDDRVAGPGTGLIVLLLGDLDALGEEHGRVGKECMEALEVAQQEIEAKRDDYRRQMNSSDNFREATKRNDMARKALKEAEQAHRERVDDCRRASDEVFQRYAVQRVISDTAGRFEFVDVPPGEFRVVAAEIGGKTPRAWALDCPIKGNAPIVLDPRTDRSAMQPYWGLDRGDGSGEKDPLITFGE